MRTAPGGPFDFDLLAPNTSRGLVMPVARFNGVAGTSVTRSESRRVTDHEVSRDRSVLALRFSLVHLTVTVVLLAQAFRRLVLQLQGVCRYLAKCNAGSDSHRHRGIDHNSLRFT